MIKSDCYNIGEGVIAMNNNPFNISFGEQPANLIFRERELNEIKENFLSETPTSKPLIITGPRGCGKTVLLSMISNEFSSYDDWIVVDLNPFMDMHEQLASKIIDKGKLRKLFLKVDFNFSFKCLSFSINGDIPVNNVSNLLEYIFEYLNKKKIKVLISIDDIASNEFTKPFIYTYQSFLRNGYNAFLIMTGLYENVNQLENVKNLTFLQRTPKIYLDELNLRAIALSYKNALNTDANKAIQLAKVTNGYAYGYQLLGNILYKNKMDEINDAILDEFDVRLEENVYNQIYSFLSQKEKEILFSMCKHENIKDILEDLKLTNSYFQVYKRNLSRRGLIGVSTYGKISFALPRFKEFLMFKKEFDR